MFIVDLFIFFLQNVSTNEVCQQFVFHCSYLSLVTLVWAE